MTDLSLAETHALERAEADAGPPVALDATLAAPPPRAVVDALPRTADGGLRSTNASVLPRLDATSDGAVRLAPSDGRRYETLKKLGEGGMGEVALVEDRDIGRQVALKRLLGPQSAPALARFVDEVRTIGRLEHPNIIPIHDVGVDEHGALFFVMKYVEGETLESVIAKLRAGDPDAHRRYDVTRRVEIFVGLLRALQYAHERGVIHRDIKPANVMVGRFGEVVLMDWGVARPVGGSREGNAAPGTALVAADGRASVTSAGSLVGTPLYMSPEQARGQNDALDARSDLYSACVLFDELLDLRHRHEHVQSLPGVLLAIQTTDPAPATTFFDSGLNPNGVPAELAHFLRRGLARDPAARWQSAGEMVDELHAILDGRCRIQCAATFTKRVSRELGRFVDHRPRLALFAVSVATLGTLALLGNAVFDLVR